ncbi:glycosyltransferase family 4 protein [Stappia sp. F7233]|uniref:Glycosyltransferase family 4 protein n=1 Tax=Stappia albiluteola TaxID=2758565 RepID=A0A839A931_9HYPH|nr:glycosyltransferase family 4 protein [Stappia albiluteola]MBA5775851.1 glycosyltransferase family 4 protein [Stappia albiluteola]
MPPQSQTSDLAQPTPRGKPPLARRTILQIIPELETGGAERTTVDIARALVQRGDRAIVLSEGGRLVGELKEVGADHIVFPAAAKAPWTILANAWRIARLIRREGVDIIHARSRAPAWSALIAARLTRIPFVTTYHGIYNQKSRLKALYNSVMARGDRVIANSHYTARLIRERHPFVADRINVIHRGSDLAAYDKGSINEERADCLRKAWGLASDTPVILNVARLTPWKGQRILIDALVQLKSAGNDQWTAVLAGSHQGREDYRADLEERIRTSGLFGKVRLVGHCDDVAAALALASVAVVASIEPEAFGRAAVEAQAAGVPVIVTDLGAAPETVLCPPDVPEDQRTGWRVPPGDAAALARTLGFVLGLGGTGRQLLAESARSHVHAHFSVEAMCTATLNVYDRLPGRSGSFKRTMQVDG